jgi:hypothetical protein
MTLCNPGVPFAPVSAFSARASGRSRAKSRARQLARPAPNFHAAIRLAPSQRAAFILSCVSRAHRHDQPRLAQWTGSYRDNLLELRSIRYCGKISYGLYLYHWPLAVVISPLGFSSLTSGLLIASATLLIAATSYHFFEQPNPSLQGPHRSSYS